MQQSTPEYMKQMPWYALNAQGVSVAQKRAPPPSVSREPWYDRGEHGLQASTFRKGACQNCGALGHVRKQCTERPRKVAAKFSNRGIAPDDVISELSFTWEQKRDRWNGYDASMYREVIDEFQTYEEMRKRVKAEEGREDPDEQLKVQSDPVFVASLPMKAAKNQKFQGIGGVRNREDMAKYLRDLSPQAPHFNPKSRTLAGENELTAQEVMGQKYDLEAQDQFAFQQVERHHAELNSTALPTLTEKIYKNVLQNKSGQPGGREILKRYGVEGGSMPQDIIYEEEQFVTYGQQVQPTKVSVKSKYEEDVFVNDHYTVWGSWYSALLGWGYQCCYSTDQNSTCLGIGGREKAFAKELKIRAQMLREENLLEEHNRVQQKQ